MTRTATSTAVNGVVNGNGIKTSNNMARSSADLRKLAEKTLIYSEDGRVNDLVNEALGYFEKYRDGFRKGLYESSYVDFIHAQLMLHKVIPQHSSYDTFTTKQGPFYQAYNDLKEVVRTEQISQLEHIIDKKASSKQQFKVPRKPVGDTSNGDPLAARYQKLRGPRAYPGDNVDKSPPEPENLYVNGSHSSHQQSPPLPPPQPSVAPPPPPLQPPGPPPSVQSAHSTQSTQSAPSALPYSSPPANASHAPPVERPRKQVIFPKTKFINTETLAYYLEHAPELVLLLDVRERRCFDGGHIAAPHVVCIEPITIKPGNTENDLEDSLVLSPQHERTDFENRNEFELVVYYDTESVENVFDTTTVDDPQATALHYLVTTIYKYAFTKPLKREPCILVGGFRAWIDDIGTSGSIEPANGRLIEPSGSPEAKKASLATVSAANTTTNNYTSNYSQNVNDYFRQERNQKHDLSNNYGHTAYTNNIPAAPMFPPQSYYHSAPSSASSSTTNLHNQFHHHNHHYQPHPAPQPQPQPNFSTKPLQLNNEQAIKVAAREFTTGLRNLGNTCYMNSIIQCIAGTPSFAIPFVNGTYVKYVNVNSRLGYKGLLAKTFAELLQTMFRSDVKSIGPTALKNLAGRIRDTFAGTDQQDCQEFLTFLMDGLHEELNASGHKERLKQLTDAEERRREELSVRQASTIEWERYLKSDYSLIVDTFQGQYQSKLQCLTCGYTSTTYNAFSSLSLPIPVDHKHVSLKDCFDLFTQRETLDGDNAWFCSRCKKNVPSVKTLRISRLPQVLIIHLKRFQQRRPAAQAHKLETFITYPHSLDLTEYWPPYTGNDEAKLAQLPERGQRPPFKYALYGVANHFGTLKGGHYTAFVKKGRYGWCYFDDTKVSPNVAQSYVVNQHAYVLFYYRQ